MFKKILLPTDGSELSRKSVKKGIEFAKSINAKVVGFFSPEDYRALMYSEYIPPSLMSQEEFEANARKAAEKQLAFVEKTAKAAGVPYEGYYVASIAPWEAMNLKGSGSDTRCSSPGVGEGRVWEGSSRGRTIGGISEALLPAQPSDPVNVPPSLICRSSPADREPPTGPRARPLHPALSTRRHVGDSRATLSPASDGQQGGPRNRCRGGQIC